MLSCCMMAICAIYSRMCAPVRLCSPKEAHKPSSTAPALSPTALLHPHACAGVNSCMPVLLANMLAMHALRFVAHAPQPLAQTTTAMTQVRKHCASAHTEQLSRNHTCGSLTVQSCLRSLSSLLLQRRCSRSCRKHHGKISSLMYAVIRQEGEARRVPAWKL